MFKLLRIIGANDSAPEIITVNAPDETAIQAGNIYYLTSGTITNDPTANPVRFVTLETLEENHHQKKLHGFLITPGMIFEADFEGELGLLFAGEPFSFYRNDYGENVAVCLASEGSSRIEGIVYSQEGASRTHRLQVLFT